MSGEASTRARRRVARVPLAARAALVVLASALAAAAALGAPATAHVEQGALAGTTDGDVNTFLGVPFAAPPIGELRWKAPQPAAKWQGARSATAFAPSCPQAVTPQGFGPWTAEYVVQGAVAEDCLYLNVWAPAEKRSQPVLVWIHGGAFTSGSGSVPIYEGAALAREGIVVVTINYRLGALGFLAHPELTKEAGTSGNYGLLDTIAALRWVEQNIAMFGGDPRKVTIAGQSAGAAAVLDLVGSPLARGLFARAIAESGAGLGITPTPLAEAETAGVAFARAKGAKSLAELRALSAEEIISPAAGAAARPLGFAPIADGRAVLAGECFVSDVPLLTGLNADEGSGMNPGYGHATREQFEAQARAQYGDLAPRFLELYPAKSDAEAADAAKTAARERGLASTLLWARARAEQSGTHAYVYLYTHPEPGPDAARYGAFHSAEIPYVFKTLDKAQRPFSEVDYALVKTASRYWLNFIRDGNPNGRGSAPWPAFDASLNQYLEIGERVGTRALDARKLELFEQAARTARPLSLF
ncbi:MAG TPA: carboxylesterase family protein [Gammaproteobacteria bacterium]|nr:carboxylesterase family protein [Gammaproteobacteria bacterium]